MMQTEENNRIGKNKDIFQKIRDSKGTFHTKMDKIKDRNNMDQTEAEHIKMRWQKKNKTKQKTKNKKKNKEKLYKNDLNYLENHSDVFTHLEPNIQECEVKQTLKSIPTKTASGGNGIPVELFQLLKDGAAKCCIQYSSTFGKLSNVHRTGKVQFPFQYQRRTMPKNAQTTAQLQSSHIIAK